MKKTIRNVVIGATCATMLFSITGCINDPEHFDAETRPVAIATGALDENFNPFFYTSGNDGEIIGLTQISMLTSDAQGNIVCGEDQATMALDYKVTSYSDKNEEHKVDGGAENIDHTTYEFVIKNGVKDSMGYDMSVLDVLFNLYVYLDPMYSGSSTIYSTNIQGLKAYRAQQDIDNDSSVDAESEYRTKAEARYNAIIEYDTNENSSNDEKWNAVKDDVQTVARIVKEGLETDWTSIEGTINSYSDEYRFTEDWEVYLWNEGLIGYQYKLNSLNNRERIKDGDGKYYTTLDEKQEGTTSDTVSMKVAYHDRIMEPALEGLTGTEKQAKMKETAVGIVFDNYFRTTGGVYTGRTIGSLTNILRSSYAGEIIKEFTRDEMSKASQEANGELTIKSISGITVQERVTTFTGGVMGADLKGEEHAVLKIKIDRVDPAAIYNFAFTVAPMHYYSGTLDGVDYIKRAQDNWRDPNVSNRFGVCFQNSQFMDGIVGSKDKRDVPVGAGPYKKNESASQFYDRSMVRYERNENFETLGSGINNAKIKLLNYVYTTDDQIINSLKKRTIDYGQPNCTPKNVQQISGVDYLNNLPYDANGFGYVGINPTAVPDRAVRIAIMLAMNPQNYIITNYYSTDYSSAIFRPTSTTNFLNKAVNDPNRDLKTPYVFRDGPIISGTKLEWTDQKDKITDLVESADWVKTNGKYMKNGKMLSLTFTIAGDSDDHPAWQMFHEAAAQLNALGFDITVKRDKQALLALAAGKLAVWAAAWSTGIDPDMYQIYHKDSSASSTLNWGYETIKNNSTVYAKEFELINHLSDEIDLARGQTDEKYRSEHYINALNDVMELAVELPTYQRKDLGVYNNKVIKADSLNQKPSANAGLLFKIWELDYN